MTYSPGGIRQFIRQTLGCTCPDEVFERIEQGASHESIADIPVSQRLLIGEQLLVYLWQPDAINSLKRDLPRVVERGRYERDANGYNRFRLVILTHGSEALEKTAGELFREAAGDDKKLHIHFVDAAEAEAALR